MSVRQCARTVRRTVKVSVRALLYRSAHSQPTQGGIKNRPHSRTLDPPGRLDRSTFRARPVPGRPTCADAGAYDRHPGSHGVRLSEGRNSSRAQAGRLLQQSGKIDTNEPDVRTVPRRAALRHKLQPQVAGLVRHGGFNTCVSAGLPH